MAIFVNADTKVIVQGLTGGQGKYHGLRNRAYGTQVVGGVTPGKGGTKHEGFDVFNSVEPAPQYTNYLEPAWVYTKFTSGSDVLHVGISRPTLLEMCGEPKTIVAGV